MKGIILAGGLGTRLQPLTHNDNKHYLPVYNRRMIEYPIKTLVDAGIKDIILVTGGKKPGQFLEYLKNGKDFGIERLYYTYQEGNGGIADALKLAEPFIDLEKDEECVVILGDNYFEKSVNISSCLALHDAKVYLQEVDEPYHFGVAVFQDKELFGVEEKPENPKSNLAVLGLYHFSSEIWYRLPHLKKSKRGELEITDLINDLIDHSSVGVGYEIYDGYWKDMGTFENWMEVSKRVKEQS